MKKLFYLMLCLPLLAGCSDDDDENKVKIGKDFTEKVLGVELEMVYVKGGTFPMGATEEQGSDYGSGEKPVHSVTLSDYYIGKFEVTQGLWEKVMGTTLEQQRAKSEDDMGIAGVGPDYPMYYVNWEEAHEFCTKLSELTGREYALPTEAQWEYAARGGAKGKGYRFGGSDDIDEVAWYWDNCDKTTHPVGTKQPNELGIYDMSGNVWEWCRDWFEDYSSEAQTDPMGPVSGFGRMLRGGSCYDDAWFCRVSNRSVGSPSTCINSLGFRVVLIP